MTRRAPMPLLVPIMTLEHLGSRCCQGIYEESVGTSGEVNRPPGTCVEHTKTSAPTKTPAPTVLRDWVSSGDLGQRVSVAVARGWGPED